MYSPITHSKYNVNKNNNNNEDGYVNDYFK